MNGEQMEDRAMELKELGQELRHCTEREGISRLALLQAIIDAGKVLTRAKSLLAHGQWLPWLEEHGYASTSAERRMAISKTGLTAHEVNKLGGMVAVLRILDAKFPTVGNLVTAQDHANWYLSIIIEGLGVPDSERDCPSCNGSTDWWTFVNEDGQRVCRSHRSNAEMRADLSVDWLALFGDVLAANSAAEYWRKQAVA